jgi:DNA-binding transcriptional ArsR family regulator
MRGADVLGERVMAKKPARAPLPREALELVAQRFRALGDPTRLALLQALFDGERTVAELCTLTGTSQANASKHLALLLERGLVARRRDGLFTRYRVGDAMLERLCALVCGSLVERHSAIRAHLGGRASA